MTLLFRMLDDSCLMMGAPMQQRLLYQRAASVYPFDNSLAAKVESEVFYKGTAPAYPIFKVTFIDDASYFRISNGSEYVQFNRNFHEGDELIINCEKELPCTTHQYLLT